MTINIIPNIRLTLNLIIQPILKQSPVKLIACTLFAMHSTSVVATIMRHDIDPMEYLLDSYDYQSVIHSKNASATLFAPRWVITAAHAFDSNLGQSDEQFGDLTIMGQEYQVKQIHIHPDYRIVDGTVQHDIALVELTESVQSITPTSPYEGSDEIGKTMKLAGYGLTGDGINGVTLECFPCDLRGADNVVIEANDDVLTVRFDDPESTGSLPLEGVSGPGDSGGPMFIDTDNGRFIAGVSSRGDLLYNGKDAFTRVSTHLDWLSETMTSEYPGNYNGPSYSENNPTDNSKELESDKRSGGGTFHFITLFIFSGLILFRRVSLSLK